MNKSANETWEHLKYLLKHKYHTYKGGRELGVGRGQLLRHDLSKLRPSELLPYKRFLFGDKQNKPEFKKAVKKHYSRNRHHPQHWGIGGTDIMPLQNKLEMVADWYSSGKTQKTHKFQSLKSWFGATKGKLNIDAETRAAIEERLK